jgi:nucleoside-diphosphate-sugar epimerase
VKKILVTGGAGFFGANLVRCLAAAGDVEEVVCADLDLPDALVTRYLAPVASRVRAVQVDVTDRAAYTHLVRELEISHVVHAAAITPDDLQERVQPGLVVDVNLGGSVNVLEALAGCPSLERLLLISSSGVYGSPGLSRGEGAQGAGACSASGAQASEPRQREDGPLCLAGLYSITKRCAELLGERYAAISGKPVAAARLGPLYGPLERPGPTRPRSTAIQELATALREGRPVRVAGPDVVRDWTYVGDAAEAVKALLKAPRWNYPVYNVSCGRGYAFRQVVDVFAASGLQVTWTAEADEADVAMRTDQARTTLDITRLQRDTTFRPRYELAAGIAKYLASESCLNGNS